MLIGVACISAICGVACLFLGLFWTLGGTKVNTFFAIAMSALFTPMAIVAFLVYLPRNATWRALGQKLHQQVGTRYTSIEDAAQYVGRTGVAVTPARPVGTGEFRGRRLDVVSESGYIPKGARIQATRIDGDKLVVREASVGAEGTSGVGVSEG